MALAIDKSVIVVLALESALWGFSLMMFGMTLYLTCRGRSRQEINRWNIARSCMLLIGSTIHLAALGTRVVNAFVIDTHFPGGPDGYLARLHRESIYMCAMYCFQTLLGDAIVIHRCYVVWQNIWLVIVPIMLWFGTAGFAITIIRRVVLKLNNGETPLATSLGLFMIPVFSLTLAANLLSTGLLAFRIYRINRELSRLQAGVLNSTIYPVMRTAIDAGVLYTLLLIAAIINQTRSTDPFELTSIIVPCISIIFYMFIMRIALTQASQSTSTPNARSSRSILTHHQIRFPFVGIPRSGSNKMSEFVKEGAELSLDERLPPSAPAV